MKTVIIAIVLASSAGIAHPAKLLSAPPSIDVAVLTPYGDFWAAKVHVTENADDAFDAPQRIGPLGYRFSESDHWQTLVGDFNGDGFTDVSTITGTGEFWVAINSGTGSFSSNNKNSTGWRYDPDSGWRTFTGDFNGDGKTDLVMVTQYGDRVWEGLNTAGVIATPTAAGDLGFRYNPSTGFWIGIADMNGDGRDDIVQTTDIGQAWVSLANPSGTFAAPTKWASSGFRWDILNHSGLVLGDLNGDGMADLVVTSAPDPSQNGETWVAFSSGSSLNAATRWFQNYFRDGFEGCGSGSFSADMNQDGVDDLEFYYIPSGNSPRVEGAYSTGHDLGAGANRSFTLGFQHCNLEGPWQMYLGHFLPDAGKAAPIIGRAALENLSPRKHEP